MRTRVKICGITRPQDARAAAEAGADAIGLVFYPPSPRFLSAERAIEIRDAVPAFVQTVALFVNADAAQVAQVMGRVRPALLQFHGDETPAQCEASGRTYIRAARMHEGFALLDFAHAHASAAALLLDADVQGYGGGGKVFDWSLIPPSVPVPLVLSGGLNPANVIDGVMRVRPWAVDVSSGVEASKGVKDATLMRRFCDAVREADARIDDAIH